LLRTIVLSDSQKKDAAAMREKIQKLGEDQKKAKAEAEKEKAAPK
jgi:hypothetical protein